MTKAETMKAIIKDLIEKDCTLEKVVHEFEQWRNENDKAMFAYIFWSEYSRLDKDKKLKENN